ncbi:hypothetical protein A3Q56_07873, partial [Intoshia linei]
MRRQSLSLSSIDDFCILKKISRGSFGNVYLSRKKKPKPNEENLLYAIKIMKKSDMIHKDMIEHGDIVAERKAMAVSKSAFIVHLYYSFQSETNIYLIMEYMVGGDLKSLHLVFGQFDIAMTVFYSSQIVMGLEYLHQHHIIHGYYFDLYLNISIDIKPDNMLINKDGFLKLTDFGFSQVESNNVDIFDILNTPISKKEEYDYKRTPGQLISLTSKFSF